MQNIQTALIVYFSGTGGTARAAESVRKAFFDRMLEVCRAGNQALGDADRVLLARWLSHKE